MNAYENEVWNWRRNCAGYAEVHQREYDKLGNKSSPYAAECLLLANVHKAMLDLWLAMPDEVKPMSGCLPDKVFEPVSLDEVNLTMYALNFEDEP